MSYTYSSVLGIYYNAAGSCQFVNAYSSNLGNKPLGIIVHIHGGGWSSGNQIAAGWPDPAHEDPAMVRIAQAGYSVIDVNYRGVNNSQGSLGDGAYPNNYEDIWFVLDLLLNPNDSVRTASPDPTNWQAIYNYIKNYYGVGGFMVGGTSAGGHLSVMGTCFYGTQTGRWPKAVVSIAGPLNLYTNDGYNFIDQHSVTTIINPYAPDDATKKLASPFWRYGYPQMNSANSAAPPSGDFFTPVNNSTCDFYFRHNYHDSLVPYAAEIPCIQSFMTNHSGHAFGELVYEGPPIGVNDMTANINIKGTVATTASLPTSGNSLNDAYTVTGGSFPGTWVYNQGTYPGFSFEGTLAIPASVNGFTLWFQHNYTTQEWEHMLDYANRIFGNIVISPSSEILTTGTTYTSYTPVTYTTTGGVAPYTYSVIGGPEEHGSFTYTSGILPDGMTLSSSGVLSGTPTRPGIYSWRVKSTDSNGSVAINSYKLTIKSSQTISYNSRIFPIGDDTYNAFWLPKKTFYSIVDNPIGLLNNIVDQSNTHAYVEDEIWWTQGGTIPKLNGDNLQAVCDYARSKGYSPGVGFSPAAELLDLVSVSTILPDVLRCDWILLDPYLITAFIAPYNGGSNTINSTTVNNTITGLLAWTQTWINRLASYGIPVILMPQAIVEPSLSSYVGTYLTSQYSTFGNKNVLGRINFSYKAIWGTNEIYTFQSVDNSSYVAAHPYQTTTQTYPYNANSRKSTGQLYPRFNTRY